MVTKKKTKKPKAQELNYCCHVSLATIIEQLKEKGCTDLERTEIRLDWSDCYYESTPPGVKVEYFVDDDEKESWG